MILCRKINLNLFLFFCYDFNKVLYNSIYSIFKIDFNVFLYKNKNGSGHVEEKVNLEQRIIQLKLKKRDLVLAGKNTKEIDDEINNIKNKLDKLSLIAK